MVVVIAGAIVVDIGLRKTRVTSYLTHIPWFYRVFLT